jgi:hypothetical protein
MRISSTESVAAAGPVLSSLKLYSEPIHRGVTSAIYIKPSSTFVYLLKMSGSNYYIGSFSAASLKITYMQAFYSCAWSAFYPRAIFKDETNYFVALNCYKDLNYHSYTDCSGNF